MSRDQSTVGKSDIDTHNLSVVPNINVKDTRLFLWAANQVVATVWYGK